MGFDRTQTVVLADVPARRHAQTRRTVKPGEVARWFHQLAVMLRAGLPLLQTIGNLAMAEKNASWRLIQEDVRDGLAQGYALSACVNEHPRVFDAFCVRLVETGEQTGQLDLTLKQIGEMLEQRLALRAQLRQALAYPVCVVVVALAISVFMLLYVVPQFAALFENQDAALPWLTQIMLDASFVLRHHTGRAVAIVIVAPLLWRLVPREWRRNMASRIPLLRGVWMDAATARWCSTLALSLRAGLPFLQGLKLACGNAGHPRFDQHADKWAMSIEGGRALQEALGSSEVFAPWCLQMFGMGQDSGTLDAMLERVAEHHLDAMARTMAKLGALLEPLVMIVIGVLVGTMLLAMYLPIFEMSNAMG